MFRGIPFFQINFAHHTLKNQSLLQNLKNKLYPGFQNAKTFAGSSLCFLVPSPYQRHDGYKVPKRHHKMHVISNAKNDFRRSGSVTYLVSHGRKLKSLLGKMAS